MAILSVGGKWLHCKDLTMSTAPWLHGGRDILILFYQIKSSFSATHIVDIAATNHSSKSQFKHTMGSVQGNIATTTTFTSTTNTTTTNTSTSSSAKMQLIKQHHPLQLFTNAKDSAT